MHLIQISTKIYIQDLFFSLKTQPLIPPLAMFSFFLQSATFHKTFSFCNAFFSFLPFLDSILSFNSFQQFFFLALSVPSVKACVSHYTYSGL